MARSSGGWRRRTVVVIALFFGGLVWRGLVSEPQADAPPLADRPEPVFRRAAEQRVLPQRPAAPKVSFPPFTERPFGPPELRVLVRDEFDRPIQGAHALARWPGRPSSGVVDIGERQTATAGGITGPFGRMEVWGIPDGPVVVRAWADGFVPSNGLPASIVRGRTSEIRVELTTGSGLAGEVRDEQGEPAAGTDVRIEELTGADGASSLRTLIKEATTTDAEGRFRVVGLRPGRYRLLAVHGKQLAALGVVLPSAPVLVQLRSGERGRGRLEGRVVAPEDEGALMCRIEAHRRERPGFGSAVPRHDGHFELSLDPGDYDVRAYCDESWPSLRATGRVAVTDGATSHLDLTLVQGLAWTGQVRDESGAPIENVFVRAELIGAGDPGRVIHGFAAGRSGADGRFVLEGLALASYRIIVESGMRSAETSASPAGGPLALTLPPEPHLRGRVLGPDGAPVRKYRVNSHEISDDEGRFSYVRWFDERELRIIALGVGSAVVPLATGRVSQDVGTIVLRGERTVVGRVIDARTGAPVGDALLEPGVEALDAMVGFEHYNGGEDVAGSTRSDEAGRFRYPHASTTPVLISHPGYMRIERVLAQGQNVIALQPAAVLEGRVASVREATCVTATGEASVTLTSTTEPGGTFRIPGLDRGTWTVTAGCTQDGHPVTVHVDGPGTYSVVVPPPGDP